MPIYFDHNATCPLDPEAFEAMRPYLEDDFGNPSSIHSFGQRARRGIDLAREQAADLIGADPEELVFTSGGTESDNLAILGGIAAQRNPDTHIVVSPIEHQAVLGPVAHLEERGVRVTRLAALRSGEIEPPPALNDATLVSVMTANNDTGVLQPVPAVAALAHDIGAMMHTDAVQAVGKIPVEVDALGIDLLSFSSHKIYGPKGAGALYVRRGAHLAPHLFGGHQENRRRAGTENVPAIVGFGKACALAKHRLEADMAHIGRLRDRLETGIMQRIKDAVVFGKEARRVPGALNVGFAGLEGDTLMMALDLHGVAVSTGSACLSESKSPSHVLSAMGIDPLRAKGSIRFSLGRHNTEAEVDDVLAKLETLVPRLSTP